MSTESGARTTRQRSAISATLARLGDFKSAQELHAFMRANGDSVGLTTVYRTVQAMAANGELDAITREDGEQAYRQCGTVHHHHHMVCRSCGNTIEVDAPELEKWTESLASQHGFVDVSHTLEIFGTCPRCLTP